MTDTTLCKDALELSAAINKAIDTGERINGELTHAAKLAVEAALRRYFFHKNGLRDRQKRLIAAPCPDCERLRMGRKA